MNLLLSTRQSVSDAMVIEVGAKCGSGNSNTNFDAAAIVLVFPTAGWPIKKTYKFGYNGADVVIHTLHSSVAAITDIADHLLYISADSRLSVCLTKLSIQDVHFLTPLPLVTTFVGFESIRIILTGLAPIPSSGDVMGHDKNTIVI